MTIVHLSGKFDHQTAPETRRQLMEKLKMLEKQNSFQDLSVDLTKVTKIDSAGLATLVEILFLTRLTGRRLRLDGVGNHILKPMQTAQLEKIFSIRPLRKGPTVH